MALMLLPHWTDGCIGSMEGLFFEASATTPFHFLTQVELSAAPSAAQRDLPVRRLRHRQGRAPPPADGRPLLPRHLGRGDDRRTRPARPHGAGHVGPVGDLRGGRLRPRHPARQRAGRARRRQRRAGRLDLPDEGRRTASAPDPPCGGTRTSAAQDVLLASSGPDAWQRVDVDDPQPDQPAGRPRRGERPRGGHRQASRSTSTRSGRRCSSRRPTSRTGTRAAPTARTAWRRT